MPEKTPRRTSRPAERPLLPVNENGVAILSGGNPQIARGDGDAPVQQYIANMPEWKSEIGRQLDDLIVRTVPNVRKAVRWNSPFYGVEGQGWFISYHVFNKYVKVTFLNGKSLNPHAPGGLEGPGRPLLPHIRSRYGCSANGGVGKAGGSGAGVGWVLGGLLEPHKNATKNARRYAGNEITPKDKSLLDKLFKRETFRQSKLFQDGSDSLGVSLFD